MTADPRTAPDADLVDAARSGDASALDALAARHYGAVFGLAYRMLGDAAEARDAAQETFARATAAIASCDPSRSFPAWLLSITTNLVRDRFRRRKPVALQPDDDRAVDLPPDARLIREEDRSRVLAAFAALPVELRLVATLVYQGRPHPEIAATLGISVNAVRIRLFRALAQLRGALREKP